MKTSNISVFIILAFSFINIPAQSENNNKIQLNKKNSVTPDSVISKIPMVPPDFSKSFNTPFVIPDNDCSFSMPVLPNRGNNPKDTPALKYKPLKKKKGTK